jgi:3,4-dihydroxy 2-butanone 4-phosphate synthase/GTP cyclohydrolase II
MCLTMEGSKIDALGLNPMVPRNLARRSTAFTASIEAREGITTGISAKDRAHTIQTAINPSVKAHDIVSPGHVFPLRAADGGVLKRNGHTEGSVDLMRLAGLNPCGVICEIMNADGTMARRPQLDVFAAQHGLMILTIRDIVEHRLSTEKLVVEVATAELPSTYSDEPLRIHAFRSMIDGTEHVAIVKHSLGTNPLVRVHSECLTGDALGSLRCDCGSQLQEAIRLVSQSDGGAVIYMRGHEGRGIGLANKIRAYALQDKGSDTVEANEALGFPDDARDYAIAAQIIKALGISHLTLLTNNPRKVDALVRYGIDVTSRQPLVVTPNPFNSGYLNSKREKLGHVISHQQG